MDSIAFKISFDILDQFFTAACGTLQESLKLTPLYCFTVFMLFTAPYIAIRGYFRKFLIVFVII